MAKYKISVSMDEKNFFWIIVENHKIINNNPTKEELSNISKTICYNETNICPRCREENGITDRSILYPGRTYREKNKDGKKTGKWVCSKHWSRYYNNYDPNSWNNIRKGLANYNIDNQNPNSSQAKGDKGEELLSTWKNYKNLGKKDYHSRRDFLDEETGMYYQVKTSYYNPIETCWSASFQNEIKSIGKGFMFKDLYLFCISEDGKRVERVYRIPEKEIEISEEGITKRTIIKVYKNPTDSWGNHITPWYEQYRISNENEELKKLNEMWREITMQKNLENAEKNPMLIFE